MGESSEHTSSTHRRARTLWHSMADTVLSGAHMKATPDSSTGSPACRLRSRRRLEDHALSSCRTAQGRNSSPDSSASRAVAHACRSQQQERFSFRSIPRA